MKDPKNPNNDDRPFDEKDQSFEIVKIVGTMPESPTNTNSTAEEQTPPKEGATAAAAAAAAASSSDAAEKKAACSNWYWAIGCLLALVVVATALTVALLMTGEVGDTRWNEKDRSSDLNFEADGEFSPGSSGGSSPVTMTEAPSDVPTTPMPSAAPSLEPSGAPSDMPSGTPSMAPSDSPSDHPTDSPSVSPTESPTAQPTIAYFPQNPEPNNPPRGYFNYDPDSRYGPRNWNRIDTRDHWLEEFSPDGFGAWDNFHDDDLTNNICGGPDRKQSPKDLVETEPCDAGHEIRTECATYALSNDDAMEKLILPHKLSIQFKRRSCMDLDSRNCLSGRPPMADYPRYASGPLNIEAYSDMHHWDIKVPGEHTMQGEAFDAEIQMFHTSLAASRLSSIGVVVRAEENGPDNESYEHVLREFQAVYDLHKMECLTNRRHRTLQLRGRRNGNQTSFDETDDEELNFLKESMQNLTESRKLQRRAFDPYSDDFMPTMFFYRYDGSITEPPCRDITWWVMTQPMKISERQLRQTKRILFSHVDSNCNPTSVHNADQSVARPIQPLGRDREIQYCPDGSFESDVNKGRPPGKRCRPNGN